MKLHIADKFKITTGYGKRIFKVLEVSADAFQYKCADTETNELFFFSEKGLEVYEELKQLWIIERAAQSKKLQHARTALESAHVKAVEASFEYDADGARYYSAITKDSGIPHLYTVKVWEDSDGVTFARCNCIAKSACRHIARIAVEDAQKCGRNVHYASFSNYRAHEQRRLAA